VIHVICEKTGAIDHVLRGFKYADQPALGWARILGRLVLGWLEANLSPDDYDLIVANPTHVGRPVRHTELILEAAASEDLLARWPIFPYTLQKAIDTPQSATGGWHAKWNAACLLRGAVQSSGLMDLRGARVLVFDDITTTCSQFQILGEILAGYGAVRVDGLVIARQVHRPRPAAPGTTAP